MDRSSPLVAFGVAALAAVFVAIGFRGQERYEQARSERAAGIGVTEESSLLPWLKSGLAPAERRTLLLACSLAALGSYVWILVMAVRESLPWGLAVLFGNWVGALAFTVFVPRQSLLPLFVMTSAYGLSFFAVSA